VVKFFVVTSRIFCLECTQLSREERVLKSGKTKVSGSGSLRVRPVAGRRIQKECLIKSLEILNYFVLTISFKIDILESLWLNGASMIDSHNLTFQKFFFRSNRDLSTRCSCCWLSETLEMWICNNFACEISCEEILYLPGCLNLLRWYRWKLNPVSLNNLWKQQQQELVYSKNMFEQFWYFLV